MAEYKQLYKDLLQAHADFLDQRFKDHTKMLDDLRNGRASDPNYQPYQNGQETEGPRMMPAFDGYEQRIDTGGTRVSGDETFTRKDGDRTEERVDPGLSSDMNP